MRLAASGPTTQSPSAAPRSTAAGRPPPGAALPDVAPPAELLALQRLADNRPAAPVIAPPPAAPVITPPPASPAPPPPQVTAAEDAADTARRRKKTDNHVVRIQRLLRTSIADVAVTDDEAREVFEILKEDSEDPALLRGVVQRLESEGLVDKWLRNMPEKELYQRDNGNVGAFIKILSLRPPEIAVQHAIKLISYGAFDWAVRDAEAILAYHLIRGLPPAAQREFALRDNGKWLIRLERNLPEAVRTGREGYTGPDDGEGGRGQEGYGLLDGEGPAAAEERAADTKQVQDNAAELADIVKAVRSASSKDAPAVLAQLTSLPADEVRAFVRYLDRIDLIERLLDKLGKDRRWDDQNAARTLTVLRYRDPAYNIAHVAELVTTRLFDWEVKRHEARLAYEILKALPASVRDELIARRPEYFKAIDDNVSLELRKSSQFGLYQGGAEDRSRILGKLYDPEIWAPANLGYLEIQLRVIAQAGLAAEANPQVQAHWTPANEELLTRLGYRQTGDPVPEVIVDRTDANTAQTITRAISAVSKGEGHTVGRGLLYLTSGDETLRGVKLDELQKAFGGQIAGIQFGASTNNEQREDEQDTGEVDVRIDKNDGLIALQGQDLPINSVSILAGDTTLRAGEGRIAGADIALKWPTKKSPETYLTVYINRFVLTNVLVVQKDRIIGIGKLQLDGLKIQGRRPPGDSPPIGDYAPLTAAKNLTESISQIIGSLGELFRSLPLVPRKEVPEPAPGPAPAAAAPSAVASQIGAAFSKNLDLSLVLSDFTLTDITDSRGLTVREFGIGKTSIEAEQESGEAGQPAGARLTGVIRGFHVAGLRPGRIPLAEDIRKEVEKIEERRKAVERYRQALDAPRQLIRQWSFQVQLQISFQEDLRALGKRRRNQQAREDLEDQITANRGIINDLREQLKPYGFGDILNVGDAARAFHDRDAAHAQELERLDAARRRLAEREEKRRAHEDLLSRRELTPEQRLEIEQLRRELESPLVIEQLRLAPIELSGRRSITGEDRFTDQVNVTTAVEELDVSGLPADRIVPILRARSDALDQIAHKRTLEPEEKQEAAALIESIATYDLLQGEVAAAEAALPSGEGARRLDSPEQARLRAARGALNQWSSALALRLRGLRLGGGVQYSDVLAPDGADERDLVDRLLASGVNLDVSSEERGAAAEAAELVTRTSQGETRLARLSGLDALASVKKTGNARVIDVRRLGLEEAQIGAIAWSNGQDIRLTAADATLRRFAVQGKVELFDSGDMRVHIDSLDISELSAAGLRLQAGADSIGSRYDERTALRDIFLRDFDIRTYDDGRPLEWTGAAGIGRPLADDNPGVVTGALGAILPRLLRARASITAGQIYITKDARGKIDAGVEDARLGGFGRAELREETEAPRAGKLAGRASAGNVEVDVERARVTTGPAKIDKETNRSFTTTTARLSLKALELGRAARYVAGNKAFALGAGSRLRGVDLAATLRYEYDHVSGENRLDRVDFTECRIAGLTIRNGEVRSGDIRILVPRGIFSDIRLEGARLARDQLGRLQLEGAVDLHRSFSLQAEAHLGAAFQGAFSLAADDLRGGLGGGHFYVDSFHASSLIARRLALFGSGFSLRGRSASVEGLRVDKLDYYPGRYVSVGTAKVTSIKIPDGEYAGGLIVYDSGQRTLKSTTDNFALEAEIKDLHAGPATLRFNDSILLQNFGLGWLKLDLSANHRATTRNEGDGGDQEPLDDLSSNNNLRLESKGIAGELVEVNLGKKAESRGRLARLSGLRISPLGLVVAEGDGKANTREKTDKGTSADAIRYSGQLETGELGLDPYGGEVPGATRGKRFLKLSPRGAGRTDLNLRDLKVSDSKSGLEVYLRRATASGDIFISESFDEYWAEHLQLDDGYFRLETDVARPKEESDKAVSDSQADTSKLISQIDDTVKLLEGKIYLVVYADLNYKGVGAFAEVYRAPLEVKNGRIKIPEIGDGDSKLIARVQAGVLIIGVPLGAVTVGPALASPYGGALALGAAGAASGYGDSIVKEKVLGKAFNLSKDELDRFAQDRTFPYERFLHLLLDKSAKPADPLDVNVRLDLLGGLHIAPTPETGRSLSAYGATASITRQIDVRIAGAADLNGKNGAIRVDLDGALADLKFNSDALSLAGESLDLSHLRLSLWYDANKRWITSNLSNLPLRRFLFKLGGK